jgi:hypothetical protein
VLALRTSGAVSRRCRSGRALDHPCDQGNAQRLGIERPGTGGLDTSRAPLLDETEEGVDLAHPGPRERVVEHHFAPTVAFAVENSLDDLPAQKLARQFPGLKSG